MGEPSDELDERGHCRSCGQHALAESDVAELHGLVTEREREVESLRSRLERAEAALRYALDAEAADGDPAKTLGMIRQVALAALASTGEDNDGRGDRR